MCQLKKDTLREKPAAAAGRQQIKCPSGSRQGICPVCRRRFTYPYGAAHHWRYSVPVRDGSGKRRKAKACSWNCVARYYEESKSEEDK